MSTSSTAPGWAAPGGDHPLVGLTAGLVDTLRAATDTFTLELLATADKQVVLLQLSEAIRRAELLRGELLNAAGDVAAAAVARDPETWLANQLRTHRGELSRVTILLKKLDAWPVLNRAVADGAVNHAQAKVIVRALDGLASPLVDLGPDPEKAAILAKAERVLIEKAARFDPRELDQLAGRILDIVAPELADDVEGKRLEREEALARISTRLSLTRLGDGRTKINGIVPDAIGVRLTTMLQAYTNPRRPDGHAGKGDCTCPSPNTSDRVSGADSNGTEPGRNGERDAFDHLPCCPAGLTVPTGRARGDVRDYGQRLGAALVELLENLDTRRLPVHGGEATTMVITMSFEQLVTGTGAGTLADGTRISASEARRLACRAGIIPAVLGGPSQPLDIGRTSRLFTASQRRALELKHPRCQADGCRIPARWSELHHIEWWSKGGPTDLNNAALLCNFHHRKVHEPDHHHTHNKAGIWTITPTNTQPARQTARRC